MLLAIVDRVEHRRLLFAGFRSRWVDTSVGRTHVYEAHAGGDLPPLVLLHGISSRGTDYTTVMGRLKGIAGRVLLPELPGHGLSEAPAGGLTPVTMRIGLTETLDAVIEEPVVLYGNSLGGLAAVRYAVNRPDRLRGLLLCSPGGAAADHDALQRFLDNFRFQDRAQAKQFIDRVHASPPWYSRLIAGGIKRRFDHPVMRAFVDDVRTEHLLTPDEVSGLEVPVRVIWGTSDWLMPAEHLAFFQEHMPGHARFDHPDGVGHCPHFDTPGVLASALVSFAREVAA